MDIFRPNRRNEDHLESEKRLPIMQSTTTETTTTTTVTATTTVTETQSTTILLTNLTSSSSSLINSTDKNEDNEDILTLFNACEIDDIESFERILLSGKNININFKDRNGYTLLFKACQMGRKEIVNILLNHPQVDLLQSDCKGNTPFHVACFWGEEEIVELMLNHKQTNSLLKDGVNFLNVVSKEDQTPFYIVCKEGSIDIVELLLKDNRINVNIGMDKDGLTPFHRACYEQWEIIVNMLIKDRRVDVNKVSREGWTPLIRMTFLRKMKTVDLLLKDLRVDILATLKRDYEVGEITLKAGWTALDVAKEVGETQILDMLENELNRRKREKQTKYFNLLPQDLCEKLLSCSSQGDVDTTKQLVYVIKRRSRPQKDNRK